MIDGLSNFFPFYSSDFGQSQLNSKVVEFILLLYIHFVAERISLSISIFVNMKNNYSRVRFVAHRFYLYVTKSSFWVWAAMEIFLKNYNERSIICVQTVSDGVRLARKPWTWLFKKVCPFASQKGWFFLSMENLTTNREYTQKWK